MFHCRMLVTLLTTSMFVLFPGCLNGGSLSTGCGVGYEEMHGGDYNFQSIDVDQTDGTLTVVVYNIEGSGGQFKDSDPNDENDQDIWISFNVQFTDGTTESVDADGTTTWDVTGDVGTDNWHETLTFTSPAGTCDNGCEKINLHVGWEDGVAYYDGTCDSDPWVDV